jgi:elongator complex protein 3
LRKEITKDSALIRELHVYGETVEIGKTGKIQHKGIGKKLLSEAEKIAKQNNYNKIVVISGIGVRNYYKKLGYVKEGVYMVKKI